MALAPKIFDEPWVYAILSSVVAQCVVDDTVTQQRAETQRLVVIHNRATLPSITDQQWLTSASEDEMTDALPSPTLGRRCAVYGMTDR